MNIKQLGQEMMDLYQKAEAYDQIDAYLEEVVGEMKIILKKNDNWLPNHIAEPLTQLIEDYKTMKGL